MIRTNWIGYRYSTLI